MPIHVDIRINDILIDRVNIARITRGGRDPDEVNTYSVVVGLNRPTVPQWVQSPVRVEHRYGDGAGVLVERALQALRESGQAVHGLDRGEQKGTA